jgi:acetyltransferase
MSYPLAPFLRPCSIALVGASDQAGKLGHALVRNLANFEGQIFYVNPKRASILEQPTSPTVCAIGQPVDLAAVLVPVDLVEAAVDDCLAAGVKGIIVMSGGFHEWGAKGEALKTRLRARLAETETRLLGPNCTGILNHSHHLCATFIGPPEPRGGGGALFGQTGTILGGVLWEGCGKQLHGIGQVITLGDKLDLNECDALQALLADPEVTAIGGYLEALDQPRRFLELVRDGVARKPITLLRGGTTERGARQALTHTGRLVRPGHVLADSLVLAGVLPAEDLNDLVSSTKALGYLTAYGSLAGPLALASTSGAASVVASDRLAEAGIALTSFDDACLAALKAQSLLAPDAGPDEIVDLEIPGERFGLTDAVCRTVATLGLVADLGAILLFLAALDHFENFDPAAVAEAARRSGKPVFAWCYGRADLKARWADGFAGDVQMVPTIDSLVRVLAHYRDWCGQVPLPSSIPRTDEGSDHLDEAVLRDRLAAEALPFVDARVVADRSELVEAARGLGYPLVLKRLSPGASHKSEAGALALDLRDPAALQAAASTLQARLPEGRWLLQRQARGVEAFLGASRDPALGPVITLGSGGVDVELLKDCISLPAPCDAILVEKALDRTLLARRMAGLRGAPAADRAAFVALTVTFSQIVAEWEGLQELEFNPVLVGTRGEGVVIVDARARLIG